MSAAEYFEASPKKGRGLGKATVDLRDAILVLLDEDEGPWTVRQIYYQMSVRNAVEKDDAGYNRVQRQVLAMRREGLIRYGCIADNTRWMRKPATFASLDDWVEHSTSALRIDLWRDSPAAVEVWCEKDALAGVLYDVTARWHVPLMIARGYSSETFAYEAAEVIANRDKPTRIYYLGDFDPSGKHAAFDLEGRLREFVAELRKGRATQRFPPEFRSDYLLRFVSLAVTPGQIKAWSLPTRPTKRTDARFRWFVDQYGDVESCELDAIPPAALREMVTNAILGNLDSDAVARISAEEKSARELVNRTFGSMARAQP